MVKVDLSITLVGYSAVGKTALSTRFLKDIFYETRNPQMVRFCNYLQFYFE